MAKDKGGHFGKYHSKSDPQKWLSRTTYREGEKPLFFAYFFRIIFEHLIFVQYAYK